MDEEAEPHEHVEELDGGLGCVEIWTKLCETRREDEPPRQPETDE